MAKKNLSGCLNGPGVDGAIAVKPIVFLGGTVLSFNAQLGVGPTQESSLNVELINDCALAGGDPNVPSNGEYFVGAANLGGPVFFSTHEAAGKPKGAKGTFTFGGILQSYTAQQGGGGLTFNAKVIDPRSLLGNVTLVVSNNLKGQIKHRNFYNVYAYWEYNVLKPEEKEIQRDGFLLPLSPGSDNAVVPDGDTDKSDCEVFGKANSDSRGMSYQAVISALKKMNPLVYSPNYGRSFAPMNAKEAAAVGGKFKNQDNVFKLDLSELPTPPKYYRVPGPSTTLLDLINDVCEVTGREFMVILEENPIPNQPHIIKILTRSIRKVPASFKSTIINFNGRAIDISYGKELRIDKNRTILNGEQKHDLYESSFIQHFFGEDSSGKPIVPKIDDQTDSNQCHGWYIDIEVDQLNPKLFCPLYDPWDGEGGTTVTAPNKKFRLYENDIRMALSSPQVWKYRVFNPRILPSTAVDEIEEGDIPIDGTFNALIRYNFKGSINAVFNNLSDSLRTAVDKEAQGEDNPPPDHPENARERAAIDVINTPSAAFAHTIRSNKKKDIDAIYEFVKNIGSTYYGKQYLVSLGEDVCVIPEGYYDDTYIASGLNVNNDNPEIDVFAAPCVSDVNLIVDKTIYRPQIYSYVPTNDGGWREECDPVLGLGKGFLVARGSNRESPSQQDINSELAYLDFFKTPDMRTGPLARFDTGDVYLNYTNGWINNNPDAVIQLSDTDQCKRVIASGIIQVSGNSGPAIAGICGELDISNFGPDDAVILRSYGVCVPPDDSATGNAEIDDIAERKLANLPITVFVKGEVEEKLYITDEPQKVIRQVCMSTGIAVGKDQECCGRWQDYNPNGECYSPFAQDIRKNEGICDGLEYKYIEVEASGLAHAVIKFNAPCFKKVCMEDTDAEHTFELLEQAVYVAYTGKPLKERDPNADPIDDSATRPVKPQYTICYKPNFSGILYKQSALDSSSVANKGFCPSADIPTVAVIPLKSNISTYGPWYSENFETNSGGVNFEQDNDMCPWFFGSAVTMNTMAKHLLREKEVNDSELETGSVNYPYWPELPLGFLDNGPTLTNINVSYGSQGVTTNYVFQSYTPRFGNMKNLERSHLKDSITNKNRLLKIAREKERKLSSIRQAQKTFNNPANTAKTRSAIEDQGTLQRLLMGQMYDFSLLWEPVEPSGYNILGTGDRTVVGLETLEKSVVELRYDYAKKAFISLDGLYSPVSISGDGGFPRYALYSGYPEAAKSIYVSPNPPVRVDNKVVNDLTIDRKFTNPLTNNFDSGEHHHKGDGAGHVIDMVGRGSGIPPSGIIMNFHGQSEWDQRYSDDYRFLGLKGPLVLHAWGYDTQGKPIPNAADDVILSKSGTFANSGLQDYFLEDWLHKPSSWPVGPVDLRFDRERGMWVSPPQHKLVVVEPSGTVQPYSTGLGKLINKREEREYGIEIYDSSGNLVDATDDSSNETSITIEDRIGVTLDSGEKAYAMFDNFTSTYLLMSTPSKIKIGKFCNQWPSLGNVKDPMNAVKKVVVYTTASGCEAYGGGTNCPWALEPVMIKVSGVEIPKVVEVMNLFSNVAAAEYQTKWCAFMQSGKYYYLLAAEC